MEFIAGLWILLFGLFMVSAIAAALIVYRGWVFSILWGWFAVPVFALPAISIPAAIGIAAIVSLLTSHTAAESKDGDRWSKFVGVLLGPAMVLLVGWIAKQYL